MNPNVIPQVSPIILFVVYIWSLVWKGIALWKASQNKQINWFVAILVLNTVGILEIVYLFRFCKERLKLEDLNPQNIKKTFFKKS